MLSTYLIRCFRIGNKQVMLVWANFINIVFITIVVNNGKCPLYLCIFTFK